MLGYGRIGDTNFLKLTILYILFSGLESVQNKPGQWDQFVAIMFMIVHCFSSW